MIQELIDQFIKNKRYAEAVFIKEQPDSYMKLLRVALEAIAVDFDDNKHRPDPERIHGIDDGDYQGTLLFIVGAVGYQPCKYFWVKVNYGSCSGCDALEVEGYLALAQHLVEGLRVLE